MTPQAVGGHSAGPGNFLEDLTNPYLLGPAPDVLGQIQGTIGD